MYGKYDHYIAVDWAQSNMAIARMTAKSTISRRQIQRQMLETFVPT